MRLTITAIYCAFIASLAVCAVVARRSGRAMGRAVSRLLFSLIPPVIGNLLIVGSSNAMVETIGCYTYYLGMDLAMYALLEFTVEYCSIDYHGRPINYVVNALLVIDAVQLLLNPLFGHAFALNAIVVDGAPYLKMVPRLGQVFHRVVDYGVFFSSLFIFLHKSIHVPFIYSERYSVIFFVMVFSGAWQSFYIFSGTPIDRSMIGFGVFGLLIFYFALYYRPLRLLDRMLAGVVSNMDESLFFFDVEGNCIYANASGLELVGLPTSKVEQAPARLKELFGDFLYVGNAGAWTARRAIGTGEDERHFVLDYSMAQVGRRQRDAGSLLSVRDRTLEELELRREAYSARHDPLTGLYNQGYLYECIRRKVTPAAPGTYLVGAVDVKDFKIINDIFGTDFGDHALRSIANWIRSIAGAKTVYGRLSGDKFGFLVPTHMFDPERLEGEISAFAIEGEGMEHKVQMHLGAYEVLEPEVDVSVMFDRAFLALGTIKGDFNRHVAFYDEAMRVRVVWNQSISAQLPEAIAARQIRPYLQPIEDGTGHVVGAEALVRWIHPTEGFLSPARFVPVFEQNGMIAEVDKHMWRCACELLSDWQRRGIDLFISVNISPKDFYFMDVKAEICSLVREFGIDPGRLRLEITESVMMTDIENRMRVLDDLRDEGFLLEMDDFGSGYSSLNMLKDMPVDVLKIDMMFLYDVNDPKDRRKAQTILQNVINLSSELGIPALTEGVETNEQYQMLAQMGCKLFQGYYFAKPMPVDDFELAFAA